MMGYEGRKESCWACKYFIQTDDEYANGVCCRRAPSKLSEEATTSSVYPPLHFFQSFTDGTVTFCGEFEQMQGEVPPEPDNS